MNRKVTGFRLSHNDKWLLFRSVNSGMVYYALKLTDQDVLSVTLTGICATPFPVGSGVGFIRYL